MHNFTLINCDTDSITFCKPGGAPFNSEEQEELLTELNSLFPEKIKWEHDGIFKKLIVLKAKNYILYDGEKIKLKGSSLRDQKKEPALKEMLDRMIECLVHSHPNDAVNVYNSYVKECFNVTDISRWCTKKTISKAITNCRGYTEDDILSKRIRRNETVIWDAIKDIRFQEGDKVYLYPALLSKEVTTKQLKNGKIKETVIKNTGLKLKENWASDHDEDKLVERVYNTAEILGGVLDMNQFIDYTLVKNKYLIDNIA
jgi:DNA polymerase elongation subunit (family B)